MPKKATTTEATTKTAKTKVVKPNEFQQAFINTGVKQTWVMANVNGAAPAQDDLSAWEAILQPLAAIVDVETYAQAAHDTFYGVEPEEEVVEDGEPEEEVKPKGKGKTAAQVNGKQQAINVTVQQAKEIGDMSPGELLSLLASDAENDDAYDALVSHERVKPLLDQTPRIMVAGPMNMGFDMEKTQVYWRRLRRPTSKPLSKFMGARTITIDKALGRIEKILLNPVFAGEYIDSGYDNDGQDWSQVDRDLMEAVLWARLTKHRSFPRDPDPFQVYEELTADDLNGRWQGILDDYLEYVDEGGQRVTLVYIAPGQTEAQAQAKTVVQGTDNSGKPRGFSLNATW